MNRVPWLRIAPALALIAVLALPAAATAQRVFGNGFEPPGPTLLIVHYPAGSQSISARGDGGGLSWLQGQPFVRSGNIFSLTLHGVTQPVRWKPWLDDATSALGVDYVVQPGETMEVWPRFSVTDGQVIVFDPAFASSLLGNSRPIYAYLPPTYLENTLATMPVVYMHDGQELWAAHPELAFGGVTWAVDTAFDTAAGNGAFREAIVIGIASSSNRLHEMTPTATVDLGGGGADVYLQMIVQELKPVVDATLRTQPGRESTVMAGSSFGGLVTAYAGTTVPEVFGRIAALSPASWWDDAVIVELVQATPAFPQRPLRVYVDSGDSGGSSDNVTTTTQLASAYAFAGYVHGVDLLHVIEAGASHQTEAWAQRFPGAMAFLLPPSD